MNKGKFVLGTLVGAAAGVVAGLLTAPKSGEETRADLKAKAAELKEEAARRAGEMKTNTKDLKNDTRSAISNDKKPAKEVKKDVSGKV